MYKLIITEKDVTLSNDKSLKTWKTTISAIRIINNEIEKCKNSAEYKNGYAKRPILTTQFNVMNPLYFLLLCRLHLGSGLVNSNIFERAEVRVTLDDDNKGIHLHIEESGGIPLKRDIVCVTEQKGFDIK